MSLKTKVQALITAANAKTSASDATLTDAVQTLIDGYGQGGGGGAQPQKDVNFIDYDGTILHSYTAAEFAALTALPANPDHSSDIQWGGHTIALTSQGWNYTLAKAQAYVAKHGKLWIGQMYKPTDGKLHLCVRMGEGRLNPACRFTFTGTATIDWGDGTTPTSAVSDADNEHTYAAAGDYDVAIAVSAGGTLNIAGDSSGCYLFQKPSDTATNYEHVYQNCIRKVFIPYSVTSISNYAFFYCYSLQSVVIPDSVTSIGSNTFYYCYSLQSVVIPDSVLSISNYAFYDCYSLQSVVIPNSVTSIDGSVFSNCHSLQSVVIPDSVTSISSTVFYDCYSLQSVVIPDSVTSIASSAFRGCNSLQSVVIPNSVTSIDGNTFYDCNSLQSVVIPDSVTSIGSSAFRGCYSLQSVVIPNSVTSIGSNTFYSCFGLAFIRFESTTPPTVSASSAWSSVPTDCKIYVPAASLDTYKAATNYPSPSTYTYIGY